MTSDAMEARWASNDWVHVSDNFQRPFPAYALWVDTPGKLDRIIFMDGPVPTRIRESSQRADCCFQEAA